MISKPKEDAWIGKREDNTFQNYQRGEYDKALSACDDKRTAIDLGGNIGMMAYRMCDDFNSVHSFEPLFSKHIDENTKKFNNIKIYPWAAGDKKEKVTMRKGLYHSGGSNIIKEKKQTGQTYVDVEVVLVDDFDIQDVDFLKIDVENYEYPALLGAIKTIKKYSPVILIELHEHNPNRQEIVDLLESLEYKGEKIGETDWLFKK